MPLTLSADAFEIVTDPVAVPPAAASDRPVRSDALDTLGASADHLAVVGFDGSVGTVLVLPGPAVSDPGQPAVSDPSDPGQPVVSDADATTDDRGADARSPTRIAGERPDTGGSGAPLAIAVGLGDGELTAAALRRAAAALGRCASKLESLSSTLALAAASDLGADVALGAVVEGMLEASYVFGEHKGEPPDAPALERIVLVVPDGTDAAAAVARAHAAAAGVALARDLVNQPAGALTASGLAAAAVEAVQAAAAQIDPALGTASVEVWDRERLIAERCGGLLGVNAGSTEPPALIWMRWQPAAEPRATVHLVGKGITFDTGGLNLKTFEGMEWMKMDMGGAAAVIGAMSAVIRRSPDIAVTGICCCTDNQPGPTATKPGDVLRIRNGKTVEVLNTDAEGRLVLADGLSLAVEEEPDLIADIATLTGACVIALGPRYAGLMGNDADSVERAQAAAETAGELVWPLPLPGEYRDQLDSPIADLRNIGKGRHGGTLTAGLFLSEFVGDTPWVHFDIAGPVRSQGEPGGTSPTATGFGVRTLVELACGQQSHA